MPQARRETLRRFSLYMLNTVQPDDVDAWQTLAQLPHLTFVAQP